MPHPNSLMYNVYVVPFWPMKVYWTLRKVSPLVSGSRDVYMFYRQWKSCLFRTSPLPPRTILMPRSQELTFRFQDSIIERDISSLVTLLVKGGSKPKPNCKLWWLWLHHNKQRCRSSIFNCGYNFQQKHLESLS